MNKASLPITAHLTELLRMEPIAPDDNITNSRMLLEERSLARSIGFIIIIVLASIVLLSVVDPTPYVSGFIFPKSGFVDKTGKFIFHGMRRYDSLHHLMPMISMTVLHKLER